MADIPNNLKFLESHEWARVEEDGTVTVGISDHAQELLGDIVFVELPEVGKEISQSADIAIVESVKAASDVYSPLSGEVTEINEALNDNPEIINTSPYDDGWFFKIKPQDISEMEKLLDAGAYESSSES
jgi:glycine cleavage system H protein|tara:strand:+ start:3440 stop:3826 length:387 start_codon:yes stop_codon:yes gene_type:complete